MLPPQQYRIVGDRDPRDEAYIPISQEVRSRAILQGLINPSPETLECRRIEAEAYTAERKAKHEAWVATHCARHALLLAEHATSPIVTALLHAHAPQVKDQCIECDGCPTYEDDHPYEGLTEVHHEWPCPTWSLIEQSASTPDA